MRDDLLDLDRIALRLAQAVLELLPHVDSPLAQLLGVEVESALHGLREREAPAAVSSLLLGELAQVADDLAHPARLLQGLLQRVRVRG